MRLGYGAQMKVEGYFFLILPACWLVLACSPTAIAPPSTPACAQEHSSPIGGCALDGAV